MLLNGDNANTATTVMGYAQHDHRQRVGALSARSRCDRRAIPPSRWSRGSGTTRELRSTLFLVPGLIAYIAMIMAVVSTALSVVREKERGTMEQVRMSPIGTLPFVVGKTPPVLRACRWPRRSRVLFARWRCSICRCADRGWLLLLSLSLFLIGALGLGLLISSVADSQQVAFQVGDARVVPADR